MTNLWPLQKNTCCFCPCDFYLTADLFRRALGRDLIQKILFKWCISRPNRKWPPYFWLTLGNFEMRHIKHQYGDSVAWVIESRKNFPSIPSALCLLLHSFWARGSWLFLVHSPSLPPQQHAETNFGHCTSITQVSHLGMTEHIFKRLPHKCRQYGYL